MLSTPPGYVGVDCAELFSQCCSQVFRSLGTIERNVEQCRIKLDEVDSQLVFKLMCKHGIVKTYRLHFEESESLQVGCHGFNFRDGSKVRPASIIYIFQLLRHIISCCGFVIAKIFHLLLLLMFVGEMGAMSSVHAAHGCST
jgi:hypothetical protein